MGGKWQTQTSKNPCNKGTQRNGWQNSKMKEAASKTTGIAIKLAYTLFISSRRNCVPRSSFVSIFGFYRKLYFSVPSSWHCKQLNRSTSATIFKTHRNRYYLTFGLPFSLHFSCAHFIFSAAKHFRCSSNRKALFSVCRSAPKGNILWKMVEINTMNYLNDYLKLKCRL